MDSLEITIERFIGGDHAAFEALYRLESARMWRFLRRYERSEAAVEDLVQEVWLQAWRKRRQLRRADRFAGWLYQIARRRVFEHARRQGSGIRVVLFGDFEPDGPPGAVPAALESADARADPRERARLAQWAEAVEAESARLDESAREMLALRFGAGLKLREIAEVTGKPLGTVCSKVNRSLAELAAALRARGLDWEAWTGERKNET